MAAIPPRPDAARPPRGAWEQGLPPDNAPPAPVRRSRRRDLTAAAWVIAALVIVALIVLL